MDPDKFKSLVTRWAKGGGEGCNPADVLNTMTAVSVMAELSVGGSLMKGATANSATRKPTHPSFLVPSLFSRFLIMPDLSSELQKELKQLYSSLSEILRHFWAAFPPSSPQLIEKVGRMVEALHRFGQAKLSPFEQRLIQASTSAEADNILRPLKFQLEAALRKHSQWSERRPLPRAAVPAM